MNELVNAISKLVDSTEEAEDENFNEWFAKWVNEDEGVNVDINDSANVDADEGNDVNANIEHDMSTNIDATVEHDVSANIEHNNDANIDTTVSDIIEHDMSANVEHNIDTNVEHDIDANIEHDMSANVTTHSTAQSHTSIHTPHAEVCIAPSSSKRSPQSSLQRDILQQRTQQIINNINQQVAEYEKAHQTLDISFHHYILNTESSDNTENTESADNSERTALSDSSEHTDNTDIFDNSDNSDNSDNIKHINMLTDYLLGLLLIPQRNIHHLTMNEFINAVTTFKYDSYDSPNVAIEHSIPEKVAITSRLNSIFSHEFIDPAKGNFHFNDLDKQLLTFLHKHRNLGTLKLEYTMVKAFLCKLIIALNTSCELALRDNTKPTIGTDFKQAILPDIETMKKLQSNIGKTFKSWTTFLNTLLSIDSDNTIYVHNNNASLNDKLSLAFNNDFLTEHLLGNMLKCYLPSVAVDYFYAIKAIYIISRLTSVYIQKHLYLNKSLNAIVQDLYVIGASGIISYENKSFIFKQMPRTLPTYKNEITENTKMYILNHFFTGGQYYILKMVERSIPVLVNNIQAIINATC